MRNRLILSAIFIIVVLLTALSEPPAPSGTVDNVTGSDYSNLFFTYETFRYPSGVEIKQINYDVENVSLGIVTDPWNIKFGTIPGNGSFVKRNIILTNKKDSNIKVTLKAYGNISHMVSFSSNNFVLKPSEKASIDIFLMSGENPYGNYTGEIDIMSKKAIYNFLSIV